MSTPGDRLRRHHYPPEDAAPGDGGGGSGCSSSKLWVGNLPAGTTEAELAAAFSGHGELQSVTTFSPGRNYAFVQFKRRGDAEAARARLQGTLVGGNPVRIEFAFARPAKPGKNLWVGQISSSATNKQAEEKLSKSRKIEHSELVKGRNSELINYQSKEAAASALKNMNEKRLVTTTQSPPECHSNNTRASSFPELFHPGHGGQQLPITRRDGPPSKTLCVGYPPSYRVNDQLLHNAMILFGEIDRITSFPSKRCSFVDFRSVGEARRAKEGLHGRLFNDPRIQIFFSDNQFSPPSTSTETVPDMPFVHPPLGHMKFPGHLMAPAGNFTGKFLPGPYKFEQSNEPPGLFRDGTSGHNQMVEDTRDSKRLKIIDGSTPLEDPSGCLKRMHLHELHQHRYEEQLAAGSCQDGHWHGIIARAGSPVCHARSIPLGKGIASPLPEVVDCTARTGLDALASHYSEVAGFDAVIFLPDTKDDLTSYSEFLKYLQENSRAGVAKLGDETPIFLVPPSDFLSKTLNISGPEHLYGVVLKMTQQAMYAQQPQKTGIIRLPGDVHSSTPTQATLPAIHQAISDHAIPPQVGQFSGFSGSKWW